MITPQNKGLEWLETLNDRMYLLTYINSYLVFFRILDLSQIRNSRLHFSTKCPSFHPFSTV